jgi:hypothetical protein
MALYKKYTDFETKQISQISNNITQKYGKPKINHICVIIDDILYESPSVYNKKDVTMRTLNKLFIKKNMTEKAIIATRAIIAKHEPIIDRIINKINPIPNAVPNAVIDDSRNCKRCSCIIL